MRYFVPKCNKRQFIKWKTGEDPGPKKKPVIPKVIERTEFYHKGIQITVKVMLIKGKKEERYFIYEPGFPTCGGFGWKDVCKMVSRYQWLQRQRLGVADDMAREFVYGRNN